MGARPGAGTGSASRPPGESESVCGCPVCGLALSGPGPCPNQICHSPDRQFSVVFPISSHDWGLRHAIARYKYRRQEWLAPVFARMVAGFLSAHATWFEEFDLITAVPTYLGPGADRDWDPVGQILAQIQLLTDPMWSVCPQIVAKTFETPRMQGRPLPKRRQIAAGALRRSLRVVSPGQVAGARILVFDDVMTEGSTLSEVARVLRAAGAAEVAGLVLSRPLFASSPQPTP